MRPGDHLERAQDPALALVGAQLPADDGSSCVKHAQSRMFRPGNPSAKAKADTGCRAVWGNRCTSRAEHKSPPAPAQKGLAFMQGEKSMGKKNKKRDGTEGEDSVEVFLFKSPEFNQF